MDAENTVTEMVSELRANTELYAKICAKWITPYTSFVTSSMMGKSRHMKEVANQLPCIYICLRQEQRGFGYPLRSPIIADWSLEGAATILDSATILNPAKEFHSCFSTLRWSAFILSMIRKLTMCLRHWVSTAGKPENSSMHGFGNSLQNLQILASLQISGSRCRRRRFRCLGNAQMEIKLTIISKRCTRMMFGRPWSNCEDVSCPSESTTSRYRGS